MILDKNYYFVLEPGGVDDGPYVLSEIRRRIQLGKVTGDAMLCKVGEQLYLPMTDERYRPYFEPPRRTPTGTEPPPVAQRVHSQVAPVDRVELMPTALALQVRPPEPQKLARWQQLTKSQRYAILAGGAALVLGATIALALHGSHGVVVKDAMVRVTTPSGTGAGFLIDGPDGFVYVATANHVVDRGERVLVERDVGNDRSAFVEAFPETEIVASDPDADLAIIRIKNVEASRFARLRLAREPIKDERILAYGYPGSSLAKHAGLVSKDGKILSLVSFPAYDERYARVLRDNAVDGLLISADIEPGFSGGPTTNDAGEVVGINVTKDRAHVGQNGAVSVAALKELVKRIKPANVAIVPTAADVVALLKKTQSEYLLLPVDERAKVRETDFVSSSDLPALRRLVAEVRRQERNTDSSFIAKFRLSGQAALGIYFARLPGKMLETYRSPSTTGPLLACELTNQHLTSFLGDLSTADKHPETRPNDADNCDELGVRPLAWDLVAASLQWDGREKDYTVTKLDRMDDEGRVYRASVRISGATNLVEVWIGIDQQAARLKVFDPTNNLYAIRSSTNLSASVLQGTWAMARPRVTDAVNKTTEVESNETLSVSIDDERKVSIRYVISERFFGAGNHTLQFKCNHKDKIETGLLQSFSGTLDHGVVVAFPDKEAEPIGADAAACAPSHHADHIIAAKLAGDQLYLYRTDGNAYPDAIQLTKQP